MYPELPLAPRLVCSKTGWWGPMVESDASTIDHVRMELTRLAALLVTPEQSNPVPQLPSSPHNLHEKASRLYRERRARDLAFGDHASLVGEPTWDILLDLFIAHEGGQAISISSACLASCGSPTTGLRHINALCDRGLTARSADPSDRRRVFLGLTPAGLALMKACLKKMTVPRCSRK